VLSEIAQWLGVPPEFPQRIARFKKQAILPLYCLKQFSFGTLCV
jgi:hypothetical protein